MGITDTPFIVGLLAVTLCVLVVTIVVVPRHRGPGIGKYITQAIAFIVSMLLCVLSMAALLNKENQWFTSWGEVFGTATNHAAVTAQYGQTTQAQPVAPADIAQTATSLQRTPQTNPLFGSQINPDDSKGQYLNFPVAGSTSGRTLKVMVWLPPGYVSNPDTFYPVIMGFPGFPGSSDTYQQTIDYGALINQRVKAGNLRQSILVVPNVYPGSYDSECVDSTSVEGAPQTETYITKDLVPWIKTNLRAIDNKDAWATSGYSAGGWCASMFTVKHPDMFSTAIVQAGYFEPIYSADQQWRDPQDPQYLLPQIVAETKPDVGIYFYTSKDDSLPQPSLDRFKDAVQPPTEFTLATIPTGGHRVEVWIPGIDLGLDWLAQHSGYFSAHPGASPTA